ncbi:MAG: hypothetical protein JXA57_12040, partial [Armatimonadetes bacterium]|nr:hypothetical protein [Armatimonadota bacterium]
SIKPDPAAKWDRILADALNVAAAINEPCVFFILTAKNGRKWETHEVLFWHQGMNDTRPAQKLIRRAHEHLGYSKQTQKASNANHAVHTFLATSLARARQRQTQPSFNSKTEHKKEADAWREYLDAFRLFGEVLSLPQTACFLCEDGVVHRLDGSSSMDFLRKTGAVLGWEVQA